MKLITLALPAFPALVPTLIAVLFLVGCSSGTTGTGSDP